jgi:hypothetical protein
MVAASGLPSKCLDPVASGWPPCLWALAATVTLVREADKLTLGEDINVKVPHAVVALMNGQGHKWLTSSRMAHYQGLLVKIFKSGLKLYKL